ncbi:MAG: 3-deoxy-manno-octulosonate cytidylyltransferase [Planctomycetes bacterium]|nr:3-deoxy-manno-octulosonate cytidylyltransferase [Planctomycetota bacterium]
MSGTSPSPRAAIVIPARLASTRFPRKLLARDTGKPLIQHVYERVRGAPGFERAIIAADGPEIEEACRAFGADVVRTDPDHRCGTDRIAEVATGLACEVIVNVQGDEPLVDPQDLTRLAGAFADAPDLGMATLARQREDAEVQADPNVVKVVMDGRGDAIYFSRAPIPYFRGPRLPWLQHIGVYAYRKDVLLRIARLPTTPLEASERLEQLRAIENGVRIRVILTANEYCGIDTPEEYAAFVRRWKEA